MGALDGRTAFVTGVSRGIGRAIARRFAAEGAAVVLSASRSGARRGRQGTLEEAVDELRAAGARADAVVADLAAEAARSDPVERASRASGPIDVLANNAAGARMRLPSETTAAERRFMLVRSLDGQAVLGDAEVPADLEATA